MKIMKVDNYAAMSAAAAGIVAKQLADKPESVLGLATGSTPVGTYEQLIEMCATGSVSFADCSTYNLDEYYPLSPDHEQSYRYFMNKTLFDKVNIDKARTFVPNGETADPAADGAAYDAAIQQAGGIDLQILGIGQNGHIAFNEPAAELEAGTSLVDLTEDTITANARFFDNRNDVPRKAITMGIGSIMKARKIIILASGANKAEAVSKMLSGKITTDCPATMLLAHADVTLICTADVLDA